MKRLVFIFFCLFVVIGCSTTKKATKLNDSTQLTSESQESQTSSSDKIVDTTKTESGKITITEIEFFPPSTANDPFSSGNKDPVNNVSGLSLPNIGNINNAAIKSIKQTTIEENKEEKGESKESEKSESSKNEALISNNVKTLEEESLPVANPNKWKYIFYILALVSIVLLYLKRTPVINWIKRVLKGLLQMF